MPAAKGHIILSAFRAARLYVMKRFLPAALPVRPANTSDGSEQEDAS